MTTPPVNSALPAAFWAKVRVLDSGCCEWQGQPTDKGYGRFGQRYVHRLVEEDVRGPIPKKITVDHECHNSDPVCFGGPTCRHRLCVNSDHLSRKTIGNNARASHTPGSVRNRPTCPAGHYFTPENTIVQVKKDGRRGRQCRMCMRDATVEWLQTPNGQASDKKSRAKYYEANKEELRRKAREYQRRRRAGL